MHLLFLIHAYRSPLSFLASLKNDRMSIAIFYVIEEEYPHQELHGKQLLLIKLYFFKQ